VRRVLLPPLAVLVPLSVLLGGGIGYAASLTLTPKRLTVFATASSIPISTCTLATSAADTYANGAALSQGSNFGTAAELHVRSDAAGNKRAFVRFDLSACPLPSGARVETATLTLHLSTAPSSSRTYQVHRVNASWAETTLTWTGQPAVAGSVTDSASTGTTSGTTIAWNVATDLQAFANGTANHGWRVADATEGALVGVEGRFRSREHASAGQRPRLVVTYYP
jgi:hypothetical protein